MTQTPLIERGCVFGADHDSTYGFWISKDPRWKRCLAFNLTPPSVHDDVHYFIATSQVNYLREHPLLASDVRIFAANAYSFLPEETAIDFRELRVVPLAKLQTKGLKFLGKLSTDDIRSCETVIRSARILENRAKRMLGLL
jgi:hypothetical protein